MGGPRVSANESVCPRCKSGSAGIRITTKVPFMGVLVQVQLWVHQCMHCQLQFTTANDESINAMNMQCAKDNLF